MPHQARPLDLCMADAMPFQQHWEMRTTLPLAECLNDTFFVTLRDTLRAGDKINLCRFDKTDPGARDAKLLELAEVRVIASGRELQTVPVFVLGHVDIAKVTADREAAAAAEAKKGK